MRIDPDWPEDADGWGFNLGQFFDKITIKNNKKENDDDAIRTADELSKMMAFFYYDAAKPSWLDCSGNGQERIPTVVIERQNNLYS
ncbi:hypothetical protein F3Y22_tig00112800pilonHSYRG00098 [Hibiscus syriacus]|uniref:Uncharacterized protein n=1 Tax=Hibiscus syriacus TaxID=106335 RepID=A0A6A2Y5Y2_HIBSY|nr:hypothetical protein F3Y22_tig00112800pilonHSYRG00098 [Hibiscus syriacus]